VTAVSRVDNPEMPLRTPADRVGTLQLSRAVAAGPYGSHVLTAGRVHLYRARHTIQDVDPALAVDLDVPHLTEGAWAVDLTANHRKRLQLHIGRTLGEFSSTATGYQAEQEAPDHPTLDDARCWAGGTR